MAEVMAEGLPPAQYPSSQEALGSLREGRSTGHLQLNCCLHSKHLHGVLDNFSETRALLKIPGDSTRTK